MARTGDGDGDHFDGYGMQTIFAPFHLTLCIYRGEQRPHKSGLHSKGVFYFTICVLAVTMYCATSSSFYSHARAVHVSSMRPAAMVKKAEESTVGSVIDRLSNVRLSRGERTQSLLRTQVCQPSMATK